MLSYWIGSCKDIGTQGKLKTHQDCGETQLQAKESQGLPDITRTGSHDILTSDS